MAAKAWNWIRDGFEELEHEFPTYSDVPFFAKIFQWNDPKSRVSLTFQSDWETVCKSKHP